MVCSVVLEVDSNISKEHVASSILKIQAVCSSEVLEFSYTEPTNCHIPKDRNPESERTVKLVVKQDVVSNIDH
jgi:hypothetical protein